MPDNKTFFQPQPVNDFFAALTTLPHCSGNEDPVRHYIIDVVHKHNTAHPAHPITIVCYNAQPTTPGAAARWSGTKPPARARAKRPCWPSTPRSGTASQAVPLAT